MCNLLIFYSALWREENALQQTLVSLRDELTKKEQGLRSMTGKVIYINTIFTHL